MTIPNDFIVENGTLTKYIGSGGNVVIPEGITAIGDCSSLTKVQLPGSMKRIGRQVFENCRKMEIQAPAGSYAEAYAKTRNLAFTGT